MAWPVITGEQQYYIRDLTFYALPLKTFMLERLSHGHFPWWTPHLSAGMPFFADASHQVLYPLNLIFAVTPNVVQGISWFVLVHQWLCMPAFYALGRASKLSQWVSLWTSVLWGLSGYVVSISDNVNYLPATVWAPLGLAGFLWAMRSSFALVRWILPAGCLALMLLAGDLMNPMVLSLLLISWAIIRTVKHRTWSHWLGIGACLGLCCLLAAVQLLPTLELASLSSRQAPLALSEVTLWSFPFQRLIELITPFFYGSKYPTGFGLEAFGLGEATRGPHFLGMFLYPEFREPWADSVYVGAIPVGLSFLALVFRKNLLAFQQGYCWLAAALLLGSLGLAFGHFMPYTPWLLNALPMLQLHRYPEKYVFWVTLALCWLAGLGLQSIYQVASRRKGDGSNSFPLWIVLIPLPMAWVWVALSVDWPAMAWILTHIMERSVEWGPHYYDRFIHLEGLRQHAFWLALASSSAALFVYWTGLKRSGIHNKLSLVSYLPWLLVTTLAVADLGLAHWRHIPTAPSQLLIHQSGKALAYDWAIIQHSLNLSNKTNQPSTRVFYDDVGDYQEIPNITSVLNPIAQAIHSPPLTDNYDVYWMYRVLYNQKRMLFNYGTVWGLSYLNGRFAPLQPLAHKQWDEILLKYNPNLLLRLSASQFIITPITPHNPMWDNPAAYQIEATNTDLNVRVIKVLNALPRAYFINQPLINTQADVYRILTPAFVDPSKQADIADDSLPLSAKERLPGEGRERALITWQHDTPEALDLTVQAPSSGYVVVAESYFPGWTAHINGKLTRVLLANKRFMAVPVLAGKQVITLRYTSTWGLLGMALSGLGVTLLLGYLVRTYANSLFSPKRPL
jgi:hypothetical protein